MYGVWYGFGRAIIELLRTDSLMIGAFKVSFLLSIILCGTCAVLIFVIRSKIKQNSGEYISIYAENSDENIEAADVENTTDGEEN